MRITLSMLAFLIVEISVVIFILSTTGALPANVATHFTIAGIPNGLFMAYVHWTLVSANSVQPVQLPASGHFLCIGIFVAGIFLWIALIMLKFSRQPKT